MIVLGAAERIGLDPEEICVEFGIINDLYQEGSKCLHLLVRRRAI